MIKKKLHTLHYLQNKKEIDHINNIDEHQLRMDRIMRNFQEDMERLNEKHERRLRKIKLNHKLALGFTIGLTISVVVVNLLRLLGVI